MESWLNRNIYDRLNKLQIVKSTREDWDYILDLRNNTREFYCNTEIIQKEDHYRYMSNTDAIVWIAYLRKEKIGFLKLNGTDLAIVLDAKYRGKGYAKTLLKLGIIEAKLQELTAIIKQDNISLLKLYQSLGYEKVGKRDGFILYRWQK